MKNTLTLLLGDGASDGGTLLDLIKSHGLGSWAQRKLLPTAVPWFADLAQQGVDCARDLKPENVLFVTTTKGRSGGGSGGVAAATEDTYYPFTLKIADFGLSRSIKASQSKIVTSAGAGTEMWRPPEGLTTTTYTFSYDVHPCGSLMYFILSGGEHAFGGNSSFQIQKNLFEGKHKLKLKAFTEHCAEASKFVVGAGETKASARGANGGVRGAGVTLVAEWKRKMAMHLIDRMLQKNPLDRPSPRQGDDKSLCMQVVLRHPFFMTSTEKLADIARGKDTNWKRLRGRAPKRGSGRDLDWREVRKLRAILEVVELEDQHYGKDLAELARLVRNARVHLQENARLQALLGVDSRSRWRRDGQQW